MTRNYAQLMEIYSNNKITKQDNYDAYYHLQLGLLLALHDNGRLSFTQYECAEKALKQQRAERAMKLREEQV